jgi:Lrp/AsnC family transcriptional regulator
MGSAMIDTIDQKILVLIQKNAGLPLSEISKRVGISPTPCWNRIKKMEERGIISARTIVLNRKAINLPVLVFLSIQVNHHSGDWISKLQNVIDKYDQIIEAHRLTGSDADYLLKVVASSIEDYDSFQQTLIGELEFAKMSSSISLQEMKVSHFLPLSQCAVN